MIRKLLQVSRPRFWMYFIGPYLIGIGASQAFNDAFALNSSIAWWLLFFSLPANLFVYGINDIADTDTDTFNAKKGTYEAKVGTSEKKFITFASILILVPFIPLFVSSSFAEQICLIIFIVFGFVYSLPPLRLKIRPFVDSLSNGVLYTMAGLMGYFAAGGSEISWVPYLAGALWAATMHAYSAIPDIEADKRANIRTIATVLGEKSTLILCGSAYITMMIMLYISGYPYHALLAIPYLVLIGLSWRAQVRNASVFGIYRIYPYVTYVVGALVYAFLVNSF